MGHGVKTGGRQKGTPNKINALLKDAIVQAAIRAGQVLGAEEKDGLVTYLTAQAQENPGPFLTLLGKVLPMTVAGDKDNPIGVNITDARDELARRISGIANRAGEGESSRTTH